MVQYLTHGLAACKGRPSAAALPHGGNSIRASSVTPKCPADGELWRSSAHVICDQRVRYAYFSYVLPSFRTSPNACERLRKSGPALHRIVAPIVLFYRHLLNSIFAVTQEVTQSHSRFDFVSSNHWKVRLG